ncbi:MAG TPA: hypothetical protein DCE17_00480, partial [Lactobacillus sp.]|nr:hypothetical protein [Lactobacillus sp.]
KIIQEKSRILLFTNSHKIYQKAINLYKCDYQKSSDNEHSALNKMIARSKIPKALIIGDGGYESYNTLAQLFKKNATHS